MINTQTIGILAGIISFSAYLFYILAILRGTTKPSRATWFILSFISIVLFWSYSSVGASSTLWVALANAVASAVIALLSIKYGVGGTSRLDILCFIGSIFSVALWWYLDAPIIALSMNIAMDFFALLPTIKKVYMRPYLEDRFAWLLTTIGSILNLFAIENLTFNIILYPFYFMIINGYTTWLIYRKTIKNMKLMRFITKLT